MHPIRLQIHKGFPYCSGYRFFVIHFLIIKNERHLLYRSIAGTCAEQSAKKGTVVPATEMKLRNTYYIIYPNYRYK